MTPAPDDLFEELPGGNPTDPDDESADVPAREQLKQIYFDHRAALSAGTPKTLAEREADRQRVSDIYPQLDPGPDRMLDARTLGTLVDSQAATQRAALMNLVAPTERLQMLAVVVRRNSFPVVQISRPATLQLSPLLGRAVERPVDADGDVLLAEAEVISEADLAQMPGSAPDAVTVQKVDPAVIESERNALATRVRSGLTAAELALLSEHDAQYLSVIGSNPDTRLVVTPDGGLRLDSRPTESAETASDVPDHRPRSFCLNYRHGHGGSLDDA